MFKNGQRSQNIKNLFIFNRLLLTALFKTALFKMFKNLLLKVK